jgi:hypothetical protein
MVATPESRTIVRPRVRDPRRRTIEAQHSIESRRTIVVALHPRGPSARPARMQSRRDQHYRTNPSAGTPGVRPRKLTLTDIAA